MTTSGDVERTPKKKRGRSRKSAISAPAWYRPPTSQDLSLEQRISRLEVMWMEGARLMNRLSSDVKLLATTTHQSEATLGSILVVVTRLEEVFGRAGDAVAEG